MLRSGVIITSLPDAPSPRRRKIMQVLPAPLLGTPLYMLVQLSRPDSVLLGVVLAAGTFLSVMLMAWGKRGGPICFALLFSMLFAMASPPMHALEQVLAHTAWFATGAGLYLVWAVLTTHWLKRRFRAQLLAEAIYGLSRILHTLAQATPALEYAAQCIAAELSGKPPAQSDDSPPGFSIAVNPIWNGQTRCWPPTSRPGCCAAYNWRARWPESCGWQPAACVSESIRFLAAAWESMKERAAPARATLPKMLMDGPQAQISRWLMSGPSYQAVPKIHRKCPKQSDCCRPGLSGYWQCPTLNAL